MQTEARTLRKRQSDLTVGTPSDRPSLALEHLWYAVSHGRAGASLAMVPAESDLSSHAMAHIARSLGLVAAEQPASKVLVVNASIRDCVSSLHATNVHGLTLMDELTTALDEPLAPNCDYLDFTKFDAEQARRALILAPKLLSYLGGEGKNYTVAVFATDSPGEHASAIPLIRSLEHVALCISLGRTSFTAARSLVDLIGRDHLLGAVALA